MKIAFILEQFPALSETFILDQIVGLIRRGHDVTIFAASRGTDSKMHAEVLSHNLLARTIYGPVIPRSRLWRCLKGLALIMTRGWAAPVKYARSLNVLRYGKNAKSLRLAYLLPHLSSGEAFDIICCHYGPVGVYMTQLKDMKAVAGKILTFFHGYDLSMALERHVGRDYPFLFQHGDLMLPISETWKRKLIDLGCAPDKIKVHRMGIDCNNFDFHERRLARGEAVRIISTGRLVEKKGFEYAIRAIANLVRAGALVQYTIIGDGPLREEMTSLIREHGVADSVQLAGRLERHMIADRLRAAHLYLAPSVTAKNGDREGIPVAIMEAMATGLPVASTVHSGIPELVNDGKSGFLVPERDVDALAERLEYLIEHPEIWPEMGRAGREHVEEHFDIEKLNDQLVEIYQNMLQGVQ